MRLNLKLELTDQVSRGRISFSALPIPFNQRNNEDTHNNGDTHNIEMESVYKTAASSPSSSAALLRPR